MGSNNLELIDFSFSIVLVAEDHNPTILNPDFLVRTKIVDEKWQIDDRQPLLSTPAMSQVFYQTGVSFSLDPRRLRIKDNAPDGDIFPVPEMAARYVTSVPHVNYKRIGINFEKAVVFDSIDDASRFQKEKFLKDGPWLMKGRLSELVCKFVYSIDDGMCNVSLSSSTGLRLLKYSDETKDGILINANFDRFLKEKTHEEKLDRLLDIIDKWEKDKEFFEEIVSILI